MEKCGYRVEGVQRDAIYKDGRYRNLTLLGILEDDFRRVASERGYL